MCDCKIFLELFSIKPALLAFTFFLCLESLLNLHKRTSWQTQNCQIGRLQFFLGRLMSRTQTFTYRPITAHIFSTPYKLMSDRETALSRSLSQLLVWMGLQILGLKTHKTSLIHLCQLNFFYLLRFGKIYLVFELGGWDTFHQPSNKRK